MSEQKLEQKDIEALAAKILEILDESPDTPLDYIEVMKKTGESQFLFGAAYTFLLKENKVTLARHGLRRKNKLELNPTNAYMEDDIESDIRRINFVLSLNFFTSEYSMHPLKQAIFAELIICLSDLLQKASSLGKRIDFTDDVPKRMVNKKGNIKDNPDITDFMTTIRNAVCHVSSGEHLIKDGVEHIIRSNFNIIRGKGAAIVSDDQRLVESLYEDDICFNFGACLLYYNRHIIRAFNEVKAKLNYS